MRCTLPFLLSALLMPGCIPGLLMATTGASSASASRESPPPASAPSAAPSPPPPAPEPTKPAPRVETSPYPIEITKTAVGTRYYGRLRAEKASTLDLTITDKPDCSLGLPYLEALKAAIVVLNEHKGNDSDEDFALLLKVAPPFMTAARRSAVAWGKACTGQELTGQDKRSFNNRKESVIDHVRGWEKMYTAEW